VTFWQFLSDFSFGIVILILALALMTNVFGQLFAYLLVREETKRLIASKKSGS
jgi:hypothetical protein